MKSKIFIILLFVFIALRASSQPKTPLKVFNIGEKLTYKAYFNWNFIWLEAADIVFNAYKIGNSRKIKLEAIGTSLKKYDWLYKVRDTFQTYVNNKTLLPYYYYRNNNEGTFHVNNKFKFIRAKNIIYADINNSKEGIEKDTIKCDYDYFDVLSAIYYTRCFPFDNYKLNDTIPINVVIENKTYNLHIRYLGEENAITKQNVIYPCLKFAIQLVKGTIFKGGEDMTVWITNDKNHIPIIIESKIVLGAVKAYLTDYDNLKFPITATKKLLKKEDKTADIQIINTTE